MNPKYKNITISGLPGSGSTTLLKLLKEELEYEGWRGFSGGEFMREYAIEKGYFDSDQKAHHDASHYPDDFDRQVDFGMREKLESQKKWILESKLSGFMAQRLDRVLKVLVYCSEPAVRIDRLVNRDELTIEQAKEHVLNRMNTNVETWQRLYKAEWDKWVVGNNGITKSDPIDFWDKRLYDVSIDTFSTNQEQTLKKVLQILGKSITLSS